MAINTEEVEAVAKELAAMVQGALVDEYAELHELLKNQHSVREKMFMDAFSTGMAVALKQHDQKAWDEDVRAFTVALIGSSMASKVESSGDAGIVVTAAVNMVNRVRELRKRSNAETH